MSHNDDGDIQKLLRQQAILAKFGELALRSDDLDEILTEACRLVGEALGTDLAKVLELQENGQTLRVRAGVGWKPGVVGVATIAVADNTSEGIALKTGEPIISLDIKTEKRFRHANFLVEHGVRAIVNVLIIGSKERTAFGILEVDSREPRQFTKNDTTFLRGYANLVAAAVDRLRVLQDLHRSEAQLRQAQKLEAIGQLAAGVAHDFNNILQSVSGGLELILDDIEVGTATHEFAELALTSARRGSFLTHHLLSYARKQMLQPKQVEVFVFLSEMQGMLSRTIGQQIVVKFDVSKDLPRIYVDPGQLQTALLNLAINASHAMAGGGTLTVNANEYNEAGQRYVVISVTDTGIGMNEATLAQAFEPFFTTKGLDGSGLGLSMVQGFAEQSGGMVSVESAPDKGTLVQLRLPAAQSMSDSDVQTSIPPKLRGSGCILLVDDDASVLATTAAFLKRVGFQVVQAEGGDQALALMVGGKHFDAVVTDYAMPGMNGVNLIRQARVVQTGLPALIITGYAKVGGLDTLPEAVEVLNKPFQQQQLFAALLEVITNTKSVIREGAKAL